MVTGCTELSYKRGAGSVEFEDAHAICKSAGGEGSAYEKCMSERGWLVRKFDMVTPLATVIPDPDKRASTLDQTTPDKRGSTVAPSAPQNSLDVFAISSWWKLGGNPQGFQEAVDVCLEKLGEAHRPPSGSHQATRGLLQCLNESGWHGLQER